MDLRAAIDTYVTREKKLTTNLTKLRDDILAQHKRLLEPGPTHQKEQKIMDLTTSGDSLISGNAVWSNGNAWRGYTAPYNVSGVYAPPSMPAGWEYRPNEIVTYPTNTVPSPQPEYRPIPQLDYRQLELDELRRKVMELESQIGEKTRPRIEAEEDRQLPLDGKRKFMEEEL